MYKALLFHPDGDSVTDFKDNKTKQDVWDEIENMGSRWVFYPITLVATDSTVVDAPEGLEFLKGRRIKTVKAFLKREWEKRSEEICDLINGGAPFRLIY